MATHVALESVHHLHRVHDVVAGGWARYLRRRALAGSASCDGNGPAGRAGQAAHNRSCPGPQGVRQYRSLRSLPCGVTQACAPPLQAHCCGLLCCICSWWELANAGAESALLARGAEQAVELSAPWPAEPRAHASSRSRCAGTSRVRVLCVVVLWRRVRPLE